MTEAGGGRSHADGPAGGKAGDPAPHRFFGRRLAAGVGAVVAATGLVLVLFAFLAYIATPAQQLAPDSPRAAQAWLALIGSCLCLTGLGLRRLGGLRLMPPEESPDASTYRRAIARANAMLILGALVALAAAAAWMLLRGG